MFALKPKLIEQAGRVVGMLRRMLDRTGLALVWGGGEEIELVDRHISLGSIR